MEEQLYRIEEILKSLAVAKDELMKAVEARESLDLALSQARGDVDLLEQSLRYETNIFLNSYREAK